MARREIIEAPDPWLKTISDPVGTVDDGIRALIDDMLETMYAAPGIGLAAIQVGVRKRVIVMDIARQDDDPMPRHFINPEILWKSDELAIYSEGCLSLPEYYAEIERPAACRVKYLDYDGSEQTIEAEGLLATCLQHEMDHLEGILFVDHLSALKRRMILRKLSKARREAETETA
ncbi:MAG: peptide deformylase [Proteobacteria bacterium]|nr:peptide deformylase [Pseudomonadota bacterium]